MKYRKQLSKAAFFKSLGYQPHPGQQEIHESKARFRVVACGVRWGKTRAAAMEALAAAMQPAERSIGWVVAPTYDLADRVFSQVALLAASHLLHHIVTLTESERRLVLRNMGGGLSEIRAKSADSPVSLLGEGLDFVIVDEAAQLRPRIWEGYLSQRLVDKNGWALLISTPNGKGWFYEMFRRGQGKDPEFQSWNSPTWKSPLHKKERIDAERMRISDKLFRQMYGAEFIEGSGVVFRNVSEAAKAQFQDPKPSTAYFAGLDLAKVEDFTVLVIMNRAREVVFVDRYQGVDWSTQIARIKAACDRFNHAEILVDSTGAGEPIFEVLRHAGCSVQGYTFTQKSKAALIQNLAFMLEKKAILLPDPKICPELIEELEAYQYSITDSDNVRTGAPSGYHDDCVIALGLAAWTLRDRFQPMMASTIPPMVFGPDGQY
jgi:hypothetical protein